jgi:pseudouridine-5'-phosphate glycosidase
VPVLVGDGLGDTTVAGTTICAALAGIEVFVTGGIGGVHLGAAGTFDVSADLQELAKTSIAVVCAGAKSILDIALTLEYLKTHGVQVLSCEQDNFAAFYTRDSGFRADFSLHQGADEWTQPGDKHIALLLHNAEVGARLALALAHAVRGAGAL